MKRTILALMLLFAPAASAGEWKGNEQVLVDHPTIQSMYRIHCEHRDRNGLKSQQLNGELCRGIRSKKVFTLGLGILHKKGSAVSRTVGDLEMAREIVIHEPKCVGLTFCKR